MPIKIHNVRLGLATNSSSTHSIVFLPPRGSDSAYPDRGVAGANFGWDTFTVASKAAKQDYLAIVLHDALRATCGSDIAGAVTRAWVGADRPVDGYIDHQSSITLPSGWDGKGVDQAFLADFVNFILRDDIVILGGNDNDGVSHELLGIGKDANLREAMPIEEPNDYVARKDPTGFWTLFSRSNGAKLRVSFDTSGSMLAAPARSASPELVDLKITDWCDTGCRYCYQGSTVKGEHADMGKMYGLAEAFEEMKVFEVAIGGGEPTAHPKFVEILDLFRRHGIVPNFTTKSTAWMTGKGATAADRERILAATGAFAFSVETANDLRELMTVCEKVKIEGKNDYRTSNDSRSKMVIQHVMGTDTSREAFEDLLRACSANHIGITLLGFKNVGRGKTFAQLGQGRSLQLAGSGSPRYSWWLDAIKKLRDEGVYVGIGIDTALSSQYQAEIKAAGIDPTLYDTREGAFSMYIDAVGGRVGPSSYHENALRKSELSKEAILEHYGSLSFAIFGDGARA